MLQKLMVEINKQNTPSRYFICKLICSLSNFFSMADGSLTDFQKKKILRVFRLLYGKWFSFSFFPREK
jgi:hypothetical protein